MDENRRISSEWIWALTVGSLVFGTSSAFFAAILSPPGVRLAILMAGAAIVAALIIGHLVRWTGQLDDPRNAKHPPDAP